MSNSTESSTVVVQESVAFSLNGTSNAARTEANCLSANRISSYLTDPDLRVPNTSINQEHGAGTNTTAIAVSRMKKKLQDFDAAFYHNNSNGGSD